MGDVARLAQAAQSHPASYAFLGFLQDQWAANVDADILLSVRLAKWRKVFDRQERRCQGGLGWVVRGIQRVRAWLLVLSKGVLSVATIWPISCLLKRYLPKRKDQ